MRSLGTTLILRDRLPNDRRLGEAHITRHHHARYRIREIRAYLLHHLIRQIRPPIEHSKDDMTNLQFGI